MSEWKALRPDGWRAPVGYADGVSSLGRTIVTAGQIGWNPKSGEFETDDFAEQTAQALRNIVAVLAAGGATPEHLVRLTWFVTSRDEYMQARKAIGVAYREIIGLRFPAMSVIVVSGFVEPRAKVEIEAMAIIG